MKKTTLLPILFLCQTVMGQTQSYFGLYMDSSCYPSQSVEITPNYIKETLNNTVNLHYYTISNDTIYVYKTNELGEKTTDFYPLYLIKMLNEAIFDPSGCEQYKWHLKQLNKPLRTFYLGSTQYRPDEPITIVQQIKQVNEKLCFTREFNPTENKTIVVKHLENRRTEKIEMPKYYITNLNFLDENTFVSEIRVGLGYGSNSLSIDASNDSGKTWKHNSYEQVQMGNFHFDEYGFHAKICFKGHEAFYVFNHQEGLMVAYSNNAAQDWTLHTLIPVLQYPGYPEKNKQEYAGSKIANYYFDKNGNITVDMEVIINKENPKRPKTEKNIRFISKDGGKTFEKTKF